MGDLKVTRSPAVCALFYEKVIAEIIKVSERTKKRKPNQQFSYPSPIVLIFSGVLATCQLLRIALGREEEDEDENHRVTHVPLGSLCAARLTSFRQ